mmetsp:Transcript_13961/g.30533  ORF Transcript_13961/g.30533 Transcript_13961/m.30533 type:complete len:751 (+) Transcript_13961:469-2721(+)|eukprot:CAMPEP_0168738042 /NCGR_PEP_ID=MMETSP0724-20121128/10721_1 /TAXON_ID=265536 /ORGANISM="Amphiprora sp., Strain CCMP467" /LENGTH=750 /DNA_ID=CAMNT_0008785357 /DNA_START=469 /DNA_END=2721 /DNA_ORIENTATION=+
MVAPPSIELQHNHRAVRGGRPPTHPGQQPSDGPNNNNPNDDAGLLHQPTRTPTTKSESSEEHPHNNSSTSSSGSTSSEGGEQAAMMMKGDYKESWEPGIAKRIHNWVDATERTEGGPFPYCMVAIAGVPGAGRTISALLLAHILEEQYGMEAMVFPVSGYHYPLDILRSFPNAEDAIYRRGAPDTFDPHALLRDLRLIQGLDTMPISTSYHAQLSSLAEHEKYTEDPDGQVFEQNTLMSFPGFDHAKGDPQADKHTFDRSRHKVVICEGLYLLHHEGDEAWQQVAAMFDIKIFLDAHVQDCLDRLKIRNLCIPGYTPEEIAQRCETVDRSNAEIVLKSKEHADVIVQSHTKPLQETPQEPTAQMMALTMLEHRDVDDYLDLATTTTENNHHNHYHGQEGPSADWTMDIMARPQRPRGDSFQMLSRSNSFVSVRSLESGTNKTMNQSESAAPEPPQHPISKFVGTWETDVAKRIVQEIEKQLQQPDDCAVTESKEMEVPASPFPFMVALVGIPGSGKSVSSFLLASLLEDRGFPCMVCPHDGYHYPLDYLRTFPEADDFIYRRGAPDTFDPRALLRDLDRIRGATRAIPTTGMTDTPLPEDTYHPPGAPEQSPSAEQEDEVIIKLPAFDHATADPEPDTHVFDRNTHKVVLCEGLYLLHDDHGWEDVASRFDFKIYMNSDIDACIERVKIRNLCIPGYTPEELQLRCELVDRVNAMTVAQSKARADISVDSMAGFTKSNNISNNPASSSSK